MSFDILNNGLGTPIHATGPEAPHLTVRSERFTYHLPYEGQTTLPMYMGPGESLAHVSNYALGGLNAADGLSFGVRREG